MRRAWATLGWITGRSSRCGVHRSREAGAGPLARPGLAAQLNLVGSAVAIHIGAGTIHGLMYLLSLYFPDPAALGFSPLQAGLATLPATAGLVLTAPLVPKLAAKFTGRIGVAVGTGALRRAGVLGGHRLAETIYSSVTASRVRGRFQFRQRPHG
jgi:hypothetical protein